MKKPPCKCHQKLLEAYHRALSEVAGLSAKTCQNHCRDVRLFLEAVPVLRISDLTELTPAHLTKHLTARSAQCQPASLRQIAGSLRGFLRFTQQHGWTNASLHAAVPRIACTTRHDLPSYLLHEQLESLLGSWDTDNGQGRRDRAIGLCLARLGMRAGEVAALRLDDLDWRQGQLRINESKNRSAAQLPLLPEVGQAIAQYLQAGRLDCSHREVFLCERPVRPMTASTVSGVIRRALSRCGIDVPHLGAHVLRHTLASHLVQNGAALKEVADVLRHRHIHSACVYAHLDVRQLRAVAQPWPKEAAL